MRRWRAGLVVVSSLTACGTYGANDVGVVPDAGEGAIDGSASDGAAPIADGAADVDAAAPCSADLSRDDKNCGACGQTCEVAGCTNGMCPWKSFVTGVGSLDALAIDEFYVYWTEFASPGRVMSVHTISKMVTTLVDGEQSPNGIALDANNVYWASYDSTQPQASDVEWRSVPKLGGAVTSYGRSGYSRGVVVYGGRLYWSNPASGTIQWCPAAAAGCTPQTLLTGLNRPTGIAAVDDILVVTEAGGGVVKTCLLPNGTSQKTLALAQANPYAVALDGSRAFWSADDGLHATMRDGLAAAYAVDATTRTTSPIVTDGVNVYWIDYDQKATPAFTIARCPVTGCVGRHTKLAAGVFVSWFAVDSMYVYFGAMAAPGANQFQIARIRK